jgi:redox-sensitive bicupin YhaK (pirin superfamily)
VVTKLTRRRLLRSSAVSAPLLAGAGCFVQTASKTGEIRPVSDVVRGSGTKDGAGVKLNRLLGTPRLRMLDPFLMLDEFHSRDPADYRRGFPSHPHRGFETVTLMLDGEVEHKDSVGNSGVIGGDGIQWMTAGRGIVHSEMPRAKSEGGDLWGYQLWINLPARLKMTTPRYQDLDRSAFTTGTLDDARVRVLAGSAGALRGPLDGIATRPTVLDVRLESGGRFRHELPREDNAFAFVVSGATVMGAPDERVSAGSIAVFGGGKSVAVRALEPTRLLLFSARPIGEPVARGGPFVMNTQAEIEQAWADYRSGRLVGG